MILDWISALFKPAVDLIDELHVSDEERGKLQIELAKIQMQMENNVSNIIQSENSSPHPITAMWRPITSILLVAAVLLDGHFGFVANQNVYKLAELFLGIYGGSRGLEKISREIGKRK